MRKSPRGEKDSRKEMRRDRKPKKRQDKRKYKKERKKERRRKKSINKLKLTKINKNKYIKKIIIIIQFKKIYI